MEKAIDRELVVSEESTALAQLKRLLGTWQGEGQGQFPSPTVDDFNYRETLEFRYRGEGIPYVTYEQSTELVDAEDRCIELSHWEAGILRPQADGSIVMSSAHDSTRVEVLKGAIESEDPDSGAFTLRLESTLHGNDPRMAASTREFVLSGDELRYRMSMATNTTEKTQAVPDLALHLEAKLVRSQGK
jgi:hypothetical protein